MKRLRECEDGKAPRPLSTREKRILITKIVADTHEVVLASGGCERAFIATGTWMPIDHSRDHEVELQGCEEYKYTDVCTAANIAARQAQLTEKATAEVAAQEIEEKKLAGIKAAEAKRESDLEARFRDAAAVIFPLIKPQLEEETKGTFAAIAKHVDRSFVCYGSYLPHVMAKCAGVVQERDNKPKCAGLLYDDIDIACGPLSDSLVRTTQCEKLDLKLGKPINIVQFTNLNAKLLLASADINAVAMVAEVGVQGKIVTNVMWHVGASFWAFLEDKVLCIPRTATPAQSAVRLAYKAWKGNLPFDIGAHNLGEGILYASHVAKVDFSACLDWLWLGTCGGGVVVFR